MLYKNIRKKNHSTTAKLIGQLASVEKLATYKTVQTNKILAKVKNKYKI